MSFVITSGGTAGHINPALAVAAELEARGNQVQFAGSMGGMEEALTKRAGLEFKGFKARGFDRQRPWTLLSSGLILVRATRKAKEWLNQIDAQAVAAFGGYVSVPVGRAALQKGIPLLIHEQNSLMGWTNTYLSKKADIIALTYEAAGERLSDETRQRVHVTGNPVRQEFSLLTDPKHAASLRADFRQELGFGRDDLVLLIFGGSQGARHINQTMVRLAPALLQRPKLSVVHLTGKKEYASVKDALSSALASETYPRWQLLDYCDQMPSAFAAADIVVSRAGASSLAELAMAAKPALLIPFPYATADHQRRNAESLVTLGAARMILDSELESDVFDDALLSLVDDASLRARMQKAAERITRSDATAQVTELLLGIARERRV